MNVVSISATRTFWALAFVIAGLVCANLIAVLYFRDYLQNDWLWGLVPLFNMDAESNIPTFFSTGLLLTCALLLGTIAALRSQERHPSAIKWAGLALVFLYVSMDEAAGIHGLLTEPTQRRLGVSGALSFAWVIPAMAAVVVLATLYVRFILALPRRIRLLFIVSAMVYVGGAVGLEMVAAAWVELHTKDNTTYVLISTLEETLEMLGATIFIYALLIYLQTEFGSFRVRFR